MFFFSSYKQTCKASLLLKSHGGQERVLKAQFCKSESYKHIFAGKHVIIEIKAMEKENWCFLKVGDLQNFSDSNVLHEMLSVGTLQSKKHFS